MKPPAKQTKTLIQLSQLGGIGRSTEAALIAANISRIFDLLCVLPLRYENRNEIQHLESLAPEQSALIEGVITHTSDRPGRFSAWLQDKEHSVELVFFKTYKGLSSRLRVGSRQRVFGQLKLFNGHLSMAHPELLRSEASVLKSNTLTPVYPKLTGITNAKLTQLMRSSLKALDSQDFADPVAKHVQSRDFAQLLQALRFIHMPPTHATHEQIDAARTRIELDELTAHQLTMQRKREGLQAHKAPAFSSSSRSAQILINSLPYQLTSAQKRAWKQIQNDLCIDRPMHRLLQGDVGAGKPLVAALACCAALDAGYQAALMAPTDILARQHAKSLHALFGCTEFKTLLLTGSTDNHERQRILTAMQTQEPLLVIGTHALFQNDVVFGCLGLCIIDEQHRFGVNERLMLRNKANGLAHMLALSATPIPRTLAMSQFGDMDISVLDEKPPGRTPIATALIRSSRREEVITALAENLRSGAQAYWVCPLVEASEHISAAAAQSVFEELSGHQVFETQQFSIGLIHGRSSSEDKQSIMADFASGRIQLLIATTVIEVGVDVPNASIMIVENPERLGLAQLHQLRGRVGRGTAKSSCVLLYGDTLSESGIQRLQALRSSDDGFYLSEVDLAMRGPGELLGKRQAGDMGYKVANLANAALIEQASQIAQSVIADADASEALIGRWCGPVTLADA